jgi:photosystem II stability/assembly factor-like uncharacterized protein
LRLGPGLEGREVLSLAVVGPYVLAGTDDGVYLWPSTPEPAPAPPPAVKPRAAVRAKAPAREAPRPPAGDTGMRSYTPSAPKALWNEPGSEAAEPAPERVWKRLRAAAGTVDLHPRVNDVVVFAGAQGLNIAAATSQGLLRSEDGGLTWRQPALGMPGQVTALAAATSKPGVLLAATALGFYLSQDGGQRWMQVSPAVEGLEARTLAFLPGDDRVVFATTRRGLFRSLDYGQTWKRCTGGVPFTDITGLAVHPDGRTLYVTEFSAGGIFRSRDGGETWSRLPTDGLLTDRAWTVALDPHSPDRVVIASPSGGLHLWVEPGAGPGSAGSR